MSNAKRTGFMQVTPTRVVVRERSDEEKIYENPTVLMADFGLWVKSDDSLSMYTWERVVKILFDGEDSIKKVWEEAVLTVFEDLLEDLEDEFEPEESVEEETAPTPAPEASADDPESNPYQ